jgi:hypothetical protein
MSGAGGDVHEAILVDGMRGSDEVAWFRTWPLVRRAGPAHTSAVAMR